jgi:hypothetical protein
VFNVSSTLGSLTGVSVISCGEKLWADARIPRLHCLSSFSGPFDRVSKGLLCKHKGTGEVRGELLFELWVGGVAKCTYGNTSTEVAKVRTSHVSTLQIVDEQRPL